jgi:hypothetical protein
MGGATAGKVIVVAVDFGATISGVAFASTDNVLPSVFTS